MKIYILQIDEEFRPRTSILKYPKHSDYIGIECEFYDWLVKQDCLLTTNSEEADMHYLPVFWTNYYLNHNFAKSGKTQVQEVCKKAILDSSKTFTLCQYDDGPMVDIGDTKLFLGSRNTKNERDIPLLCSPHMIKEKKKKYLGNFVGRVATHPIRKELRKAVKGKKEFFFLDGKWGEKIFINVLEKSYTCLCPRGYGGSSFRFFEAMQAGVVPVHIGDNDIRPFKSQIDWNSCSFYFDNPYYAIEAIEKTPKDELIKMGEEAAKIWKQFFSNGSWSELVIKELMEWN